MGEGRVSRWSGRVRGEAQTQPPTEPSEKCTGNLVT